MGKYLAVMGGNEALGDSSANGHHMALAQRTGCVFHAMLDIQFGMTGSDAAPRAECLQVIGRVAAGKMQHTVEHWRHVTRIQEEAVTGKPCRVVGVSNQILGKQDVDKVCAAHGATGVT